MVYRPIALKRARVTRKLRLEPTSSDEETETDIEALISRSKLSSSYSEKNFLKNIFMNLTFNPCLGKAKETPKEALFYEWKEKTIRKTKTLDELSPSDKVQETLPEKTPDLSITSFSHQEVLEPPPVQETFVFPVLSLFLTKSIVKEDLDIPALLSIFTEPIPPIPFQEFSISIELPTFANIVATLAQSRAKEHMQISKKDPFPNPLQVLEQGSLPSVSVPASTVFPARGFGRRDSNMITSSSDQLSELLAHNQFLYESIGKTTLKVEKLEARAFKTASHLSLFQTRRDKLEELNKRMKWLKEEMQRVRDEIYEVSTDFQALEDEALRGQSVLPLLIPSL
ncbi:hypothetical protein RHMOL_Rhmol08G0156500 [Rhododendron molle]|uniref:Uncharacterized protein n=1 Tax=Rhododendron molle TaxID=49168 RepID=A0ACC0MPI0_RHOML|nr:hypothetical protein RHMOL_Rhmol08G0156500 [Rhododendron molle]